MRVVIALVTGLAGCSQSLPAPAGPAGAEAVATPVARRAVLDVAAAELGEPAAVGRMHHRVRVKRIGRAWLAPGEPPINDGATAAEGEEDQVLPVIGESSSRIRVVTEEDGARVAVWIDRRDAWETIVAPVALERAGTAGVWLEAGAPISAGPRGPRRTIALRDPGVEVAGAVPAAFVGQVWLAAPGDDAEMALESCMAAKARKPAAAAAAAADRRKRVLLPEGEAIRAAPGAGARVLATLREAQEAVAIARGAAWAEVEVERPYVRIRGHVPASALDEEGGRLEGLSTCGGRGFGISHADRIEVPVGTCLYDRKHGEVAGVAIEAKVRLGSRGRSGDEWSMVYVDTRWSITSMYVRDTGRDPAQPVLESCTASTVRR